MMVATGPFLLLSENFWHDGGNGELPLFSSLWQLQEPILFNCKWRLPQDDSYYLRKYLMCSKTSEMTSEMCAHDYKRI